jgi:hypothetical protein
MFDMLAAAGGCASQNGQKRRTVRRPRTDEPRVTDARRWAKPPPRPSACAWVLGAGVLARLWAGQSPRSPVVARCSVAVCSHSRFKPTESPHKSSLMRQPKSEVTIVRPKTKFSSVARQKRWWTCTRLTRILLTWVLSGQGAVPTFCAVVGRTRSCTILVITQTPNLNQNTLCVCLV